MTKLNKIHELALRALGLSCDATQKDIKKRYFRLARKHHPDKKGDATLFKDVQNAYEVLLYLWLRCNFASDESTLFNVTQPYLRVISSPSLNLICFQCQFLSPSRILIISPPASHDRLQDGNRWPGNRQAGDC